MSEVTKISTLTPQVSTRQKIRVLSIDGGGIRGIIPATILAHLEQKLQNKSGDATVRLSDHFDFIAGTSTGGILASVYLAPDKDNPMKSRYSAKDALDLYLKKGSQIFRTSFFDNLKSYFGLLRYKFRARGINEALKETFGESHFIDQFVKPCLITAYNITKEQSQFFTRCSAKNNARKNFRIWEVARATSAAPSFFRPARLLSEYGECHTMIDGGVIANNPALCAYTEVIKSDFSHLSGWESGDRITADDIIMVSLGTGIKTQPTNCEKLERKGLLGWLKTVTKVRMMGSTDTVQHQVEQIFKSSLRSAGKLFRIDPGIFDADRRMDNASATNIDLLHKAGERNAIRFDAILEKIADNLIAESNVAVTSESKFSKAS